MRWLLALHAPPSDCPCSWLQVKASIASFASAMKQEGSTAEVTDLVMKAFAEKAVVMEDGKPLDNFKVRRA